MNHTSGCHQKMLHDHMDDCREIVVAANVAEFVHDGRELTGCAGSVRCRPVSRTGRHTPQTPGSINPGTERTAM